MYVIDGKRLVESALARRMRELGYKAHPSHVSRVLNGERHPGQKFIEGMAKAMGITKDRAREIIRRTQEAAREHASLPSWL